MFKAEGNIFDTHELFIVVGINFQFPFQDCSTPTTRGKGGHSKRRAKMLSEDQMRADQKEWCCPLKCSEKISFGDFKQARTSFWGECSEKQQRQFVFSFFQVAGGTTVACANDLKFLIAGKQVCRKAWLTAHHISNGRLVVHVNSDLKARTNLTMILRNV